MIVKTVQNDIFTSNSKHIAFAVNTEGINDTGIARQVSKRYWPELAKCGFNELGTVITRKIDDITFHALVCYSLIDGWNENQAEIIKQCFDKIRSDGKPIASDAIGAGFTGFMRGADFKQIICGMHDAEQQIELHSGDTLEEIIKCYNEENAKSRVFKR